MIVVKLIGGLGNQMFQYAAGRRLAILHHVLLRLDLSEYSGTNAYRNFDLAHFEIQASAASDADLAPYSESPAWSRLRKKIWRVYHKLGLKRPCIFLEKQSGQYDPAILETPSNVYLSGFWQSEGYFQDIRPIIQREFQLKADLDRANAALANQIQSSNAVSLHIRRGDYANNPAITATHGLMPVAYYQIAVQQIAKQVSDPHFFVFSDEPQWAYQYLDLPYPTTIVDNNAKESYKDLWLMTLCRHHIIANSTFSWWGAWLASNPQQIVIAPKQWFQGPRNEVFHIVPQRWQRL